MKTIPILDISRSCNGCTACCEGWLHGEAHSHKFWPGRKCHYVSETGCTIYEQRPHDPCQIFKCEWLIDGNFPEWLKPSLSKVIFVRRNFQGFNYIHAVEAGGKMESEVLSWLIMAYLDGKLTNVVYNLNGGTNIIGNKDFVKAMTFGVEQEVQVI